MSSTDIYFPNKHYQLKNKETSRIIRKRSRKGSERWYQHVQHKRSSNSFNGIRPRYCNHRGKSIITPRLSQKNPIIQDCISYYNTYHDIKNENTFKNQQNTIPVWICNRCTYNNIERKSYCNVCYFEYSTSKNMVSKRMDINSNTSTEFSLMQFMKHEDNDKIYNWSHQSSNQSLNGTNSSCDVSSNSKTKRNRKRRKRSRQKKLKKILDETEHQKWLQNVMVKKKKKKKKKIQPKNKKHNFHASHRDDKMTEIKANNISIMLKMSLKPIVKYQYIAPKLMLTRNYHRKCGYWSLIKGQNWTETYSVDNPMKLKNFELLEIQVIVKDIIKNKQINTFVLNPNKEKRLCFPIYLCENSWVDLSSIPMNNKMFQIASTCMKQCMPDMLVNNIEYDYNSIHDPNYNLLPICDDMSRILIEYMPSMDIIHNILLEYIGYKEIGYVYMNVKNVSFRNWTVKFSKDKTEDQIIDIDYDKYKYVYSPTDELYRDDHDLDKEYDTESSSSLAGGNLFGGDDSSTDSDSSSDDDYRYQINRHTYTRPSTGAIRRRDRRGWCYWGPSYTTPCRIYKFDNYCIPERKAKITKYPLKYMKVRSPNRYLQRKWNAYYKLRNDYFEH